MEYYKELFFAKKKHSYELNSINFYAENEEDIVKYNNIPAKGFKLVNGSLLDPVTGYLFHPDNAYSFKDLLITRNIWRNGVCVEPIIFEYVKDGSFRAHLYADVENELVEVSVHDKVSLSESKPGTILRSIEDESYYLYMGMVGQLYVNESGKGSVKKKHLVLKTDFFNEGDESNTELIIRHFNYVDFTKDKIKSYFKIKDISPDKLKIKYYSYGSDIIKLGEYINNDKFDVYDFQRDYPSLLLTSTVRLLFTKDDISMTRNHVKLQYEFLGEMGLQVIYNLTYSSFDSKTKTFYNVEIKPEIRSKAYPQLDFNKHNYAIEYNNEKMLITPRRLVEIVGYNSSSKKDLSLFSRYSYPTEFYLYKLDSVSVISNRKFYMAAKQSTSKTPPFNWFSPVKIYQVEYLLNEQYSFNLFNTPFDKCGEIFDALVVNDSDAFDQIKNTGRAVFELFGGWNEYSLWCFRCW